MLLNTNYNAKTFAVKDVLIIWDRPGHRVNADAWTNLNRDEGPTCVVAFACKLSFMNLINKFIDSLAEHDRRRRDFALTLFISLDVQKQKLNVVRSVAGRLLNLPFRMHVNLTGHRLYGFETQRIDDGQQVAYMINFNQILGNYI